MHPIPTIYFQTMILTLEMCLYPTLLRKQEDKPE